MINGKKNKRKEAERRKEKLNNIFLLTYNHFTTLLFKSLRRCEKLMIKLFLLNL